MVFSKEGFEHFKNIFHPNLVANKNHYLKNGLYIFPPYHGCGLRNKNGTNKEIDCKLAINVCSQLKNAIGNLIKQLTKRT